MTINISKTYDLEDEFSKEEYLHEKDNRGKLKWKSRFNVLKQNYKIEDRPFIVGLDTETFSSNGNLLCLNNSYNDDTLLGGSTWETILPLDEIYIYLLHIKQDVLANEKTDNVIVFFWNLKFDASVLLKSLKEHLMEFYTGYSKEEKLRGVFNGLKVEYLNKKCLTLNDKDSHKKFSRVVIYDAMQLWKFSGVNGKSSLDSVAEKHLNLHKQDDEVNKIYPNKQFPNKISKKNLKIIIKYCIEDCKLIPKLVNLWLDKFYASFKYYPQKFHSLGTIALDTLRTDLTEMHSFNAISYDIQSLAYKCYFGGRFEIFFKGYLENIHHADINSAYPYSMSLIPNMKTGSWKTIKEISELNTLKIGLYRIKVKVNENKLCPFLYRKDNGSVMCPNGTFTTWTTSYELDVALKYYDIELINIFGYEYTEKENCQFQKLIKKWYGQRIAQKDEGQKYIYKVLINSLYGKFAQRKPEPKNLFNPVMASLITGKCRAMLLESAQNSKDDIIMFATDGVFSRKPLNVNIKGKKILGRWSYDFHPKFKLVMAGIYSFSDKENPDKLKVKTRGFSPKMRKINGWNEDFVIKDDSLVFDNDKAYWEIINIMPNSLVQSIIHKNCKSPKDIAKFIESVKELDLNGDHSRLWDKNIKSTNDLSNSIPINLKEKVIY